MKALLLAPSTSSALRGVGMSLAGWLWSLPVELASAQEVTDLSTGHDSVVEVSTGSEAAWAEPQVYDGASLATWENPAVEWLVHQPAGSPHFGLELETGLVVFNSSNDFLTVVASAAVGLFAFLDVTLDRDETFRVGIYADFVQLGAVAHPMEPHRARLSGGGAVGVRAMFGVDLVAHLIFRAGVEGGLVFPDGEFGGSALGRFELAWRLLEARTLELGVAVFGGLRYGANRSDCFVTGCIGGVSVLPNERNGRLVVPGITVSVAWIFQ